MGKRVERSWLWVAATSRVAGWVRREGPSKITLERKEGSHALAAARRDRSPHRRPVHRDYDSISVILRMLPTPTKEASMSPGSGKQKALELIEKLPADATLEDAIERLVLLAKTERGFAELDAGQGVDHTEAKRRLVR